ncbi:MAG: hypothetical protein Q4A54_08155, partial [Parabacteroides sp.]|nr:hypothetical protein [Parabacteroides sp.]
MNKGIMSGTRYFISYLLRNAPGLFLLEIVSNILLEFMRVLNNVLLYYWIIDIIIARKPAIEILLVLLGVSLFTLGQDIFNAWYAQRYRPVALEKLHRSIYCDIHKRICDMDMAHYDDVEFYNDVVLNMSTIDSSMENIMNEFAQIISCIVSIIISGGLFVAIDLKLAIFTIFSLVITFM